MAVVHNTKTEKLPVTRVDWETKLLHSGVSDCCGAWHVAWRGSDLVGHEAIVVTWRLGPLDWYYPSDRQWRLIVMHILQLHIAHGRDRAWQDSLLYT